MAALCLSSFALGGCSSQLHAYSADQLAGKMLARAPLAHGTDPNLRVVLKDGRASRLGHVSGICSDDASIYYCDDEVLVASGKDVPMRVFYRDLERAEATDYSPPHEVTPAEAAAAADTASAFLQILSAVLDIGQQVAASSGAHEHSSRGAGSSSGSSSAPPARRRAPSAK